MSISLRGLANSGTAAVAGYGEGQMQGEALARQIQLTREQQERQELMDLFRARLDAARTAAEERQANRPMPIDPLSPAGIAAQVDMARQLKAAGVNRSGGVPRTPAPRPDPRIGQLDRAITEAQGSVRDAEAQVRQIQTATDPTLMTGRILYEQDPGTGATPGYAQRYRDAFLPARQRLQQAQARLAQLQAQRDQLAGISDDSSNVAGPPPSGVAGTPAQPTAPPAPAAAPKTPAQDAWDQLAAKYGAQRTVQEVGPRP